MASVAFNTYEFIKSLTDAGIEEKQAAAISAGILRAHETADLATKGDVLQAETILRTEIREVQTQMEAKLDKLDAKIDKVELRIEKQLAEMKGEAVWTRWMLGFILAGIAGLVVKSFFGG